MEIRLKNKYKNEVFKAMQDRFGYSNPMEVPKLTRTHLRSETGRHKGKKVHR